MQNERVCIERERTHMRCFLARRSRFQRERETQSSKLRVSPPRRCPPSRSKSLLWASGLIVDSSLYVFDSLWSVRFFWIYVHYVRSIRSPFPGVLSIVFLGISFWSLVEERFAIFWFVFWFALLSFVIKIGFFFFTVFGFWLGFCRCVWLGFIRCNILRRFIDLIMVFDDCQRYAWLVELVYVLIKVSSSFYLVIAHVFEMVAFCRKSFFLNLNKWFFFNISKCNIAFFVIEIWAYIMDGEIWRLLLWCLYRRYLLLDFDDYSCDFVVSL